jgi:hypothetical protein
MLEQQSAKIIQLKTACEELEHRQSLCDKKWADLLDENQRNREANVQMKALLER